MRRPHRNIEIFSMSVLDMFASALGAFIMCAVILFPYYGKKDVKKELAEAKTALDTKSKELKTTQGTLNELKAQIELQDEKVREVRDTQANLKICKDGLNQCQVALAKNFLLVKIEWHPQKSMNVDLHVTDPSGHEYYWRRRSYPGLQARLSVDSFGSDLGGIEVWLEPRARPGTYKVSYSIDRALDEDVVIEGTVIDRLGVQKLGPQAFHMQGAETEGLTRQAAILDIGADGTLTRR